MLINKLSRLPHLEYMNNQLLTEIQQAIKNTVKDEKVGIAFSGGVDSTLMTKILYDLGYDIHLFTIGFHDSHDINFAKEVNGILKLHHSILEIEPKEFREISVKIHNLIKTDNLSWNENSIAFYYVAKIAHQNGIKTVVTANGIDELFCGYNSYRESIKIGKDEVMKMMDEKLKNEKDMMTTINDITAEFNVEILPALTICKTFLSISLFE